MFECFLSYANIITHMIFAYSPKQLKGDKGYHCYDNTVAIFQEKQDKQ